MLFIYTTRIQGILDMEGEETKKNDVWTQICEFWNKYQLYIIAGGVVGGYLLYTNGYLTKLERKVRKIKNQVTESRVSNVIKAETIGEKVQ